MVDEGDTAVASTTAPGATTREPVELATIEPDRYTDRRELSRGGMGRIVTAFDQRLRRTVAIKEIRGRGDDEAVGRFEREIVLSAKLEHPAIVTIHDAGRWPSGEPFYVMRLVPGRSLAEAIAAAGDTLATRLALVPNVIAVADALAYAHGQRVIHRDLKPGNVMIGEFGETVVIDWGLAKELTASRASTTAISAPPGSVETQLGDVLGTPAYMPPEQAAGDVIDERGDVYAIGAILYHVLAGAAPFEGPTTEVLSSVRRVSPVNLDKRAPGVPPDLVAIVRRAMARDPQERYPTARQLADDLRAFQAGQLVGAHRYSPGELVKRWVKRHRAPLAVAVVAALAVAGLGAASIYRVVEARGAAEKNRQQAESLVHFVVHDLNDKLSTAGHSDLLYVAAQRAADYYAGRELASPDDRKSYGELCNIYGRVLRARGDIAGAIQRHEKAVEIARSLAASEPYGAALLVESDVALAGALQFSGDSSGAITAATEAVALCADRPADDDDWQRLRSYALSELGADLELSGRYDEARPYLEQDLAISQRRAARSPDDPALANNLVVSHDHLGLLEIGAGHRDRALVHYRAMVDLLATLSARLPDEPSYRVNLALAHTHIGGALSEAGDRAGALAEYEAGAAVDSALVTRDPENARILSDLADNLIGASQQLFLTKDYPRARAETDRAIHILEQLTVRDPANAHWADQLSFAQIRLGDLVSLGDHVAALVPYRAALAIRERLAALAPTDSGRQLKVAYAHDMVGEELIASGDKAAGKAELEAALALYEKWAPTQPGNQRAKEAIADIQDTLATCCKP